MYEYIYLFNLFDAFEDFKCRPTPAAFWLLHPEYLSDSSPFRHIIASPLTWLSFELHVVGLFTKSSHRQQLRPSFTINKQTTTRSTLAWHTAAISRSYLG